MKLLREACELSKRISGAHTFTHTLHCLYLTFYSGFTYTLLQVYSCFTSDLLTLYSRFIHSLLQVYLHFTLGLLTRCFGLPHSLHQFVLTFLRVHSIVLRVCPHLTCGFTCNLLRDLLTVYSRFTHTLLLVYSHFAPGFAHTSHQVYTHFSLGLFLCWRWRGQLSLAEC